MYSKFHYQCGVPQNTAFNLLFAGHDTSASALAVLMRFLKLYPDALHKLREEQIQVGRCQHWKIRCD